ncbi:MAP3K15 [Cordylochernes scorpioides]|uniref:MAP3K15 n=1 Tax=Cordylochernes scorpioides TaxID=51811 RepID=A0ABY6JYJ7_9ARAC|nr:MAP3K15 [Cordylochernes scorpioides]
MSEPELRSSASDSKPPMKMDVVVVIDQICLNPDFMLKGGSRKTAVCYQDLQDGLKQREAALEEITKGCEYAGVSCQHIKFKKLDFGETKVLEAFSNADVAFIDVSILVSFISSELLTY